MAKKRRRRRRKISRREKIFNIVSYSLMAAVVLGYLAWAFLTRGSITIKGSIEDYFNAVNEENVEKYIECCYPKKWEKNYTPDSNQVSLHGIVEDVFKYQSGATYSNIEIKNTEKLEKVFVDRIKRGIKEIYGLDLNISQVYRVRFTVKMRYEYQGDIIEKETDVLIRYIYKYHEKWYYLADSLVLVKLNLDEQ